MRGAVWRFDYYVQAGRDGGASKGVADEIDAAAEQSGQGTSQVAEQAMVDRVILRAVRRQN
jgi:hypothetical protein